MVRIVAITFEQALASVLPVVRIQGVREVPLPAVARAKNRAGEGEAALRGAVLIPSGTYLAAHHVATISSVGRWEVPVYERPTVAVLSTGDELVEPWEVASGPMIRNSNAHFLLAALNGLGFRQVRDLGIRTDERETITP